MDTLNYVERDGCKLYCFIDVCSALFPETPKSTVRNWIKALNIAVESCKHEERMYFKERNPLLGSTFGLIKEDDIIRLRDRNGSKRVRCDTGSSTISIISDASNVSTPTHHQPKPDYRMVLYSDTSSDENSADKNPRNDVRDKHSSPTKLRRIGSYRLAMTEAPPPLQKDIQNLRRFYQTELNPTRRGGPLCKETIEKMMERVMCFLYFCKNEQKITELSLLLFNNVELYTKFLDYLKTVRQLMPSTMVAHIVVCINVVKFNLSVHQPNIDPSCSREVNIYHGYQRKFQRESTTLSKCKKEGLSPKTSTKQFYFAHVLQTLRHIRDKYNETSGLEKMRNLHDFVLLALYLRALPGRSKEIRTMKLFIESEQSMPFDYGSVRSGNFIVFQEDERVYIVQFDFKNSKSVGPTKLDLSEDTDLVYYLKLYLKARSSLLLGKAHEFFFLNKSGDCFDSSSKMAKYLSSIFHREVSIKASTNALRHAIVTYFSTLDEAKNSDLRKSLALLMKHSVRYQETVYNDQSYHEKTKIGRDLMRNKIAADVFGIRDEIVVKTSDNENKNDSDLVVEHELIANVGDIVALLDPVSTKKNIHFFLGKVARYTPDKTEAHLIHLERVEGCDNSYKMKPGRTWLESCKSLIYPIDIVYNSSTRYYELRSSPDDIYEAVHGLVAKQVM